MDDVTGTSSVPSQDSKPVIVRVKRKACQSAVEAFWLEIKERPLKRTLLNFEKLSVSESYGKSAERLNSKKVLVQHVETLNTAKVTADILHSFVSEAIDGYGSKSKSEGTRRSFKVESKQDQLLIKAKQKQEVSSKNARFEQIWRKRKVKKDAAGEATLHDVCHVYDIVRVDAEETIIEASTEQEDTDLEDHRIMSSYLPLLREFIPSAAAEIESDIHDYVPKVSKPDYVYDLYAVKYDEGMIEEDASNPFPLVQVDEDDDFYDGPVASDYESDDSNAEDNPLNDYPDELTSEDDEDDKSGSSNDELEEHEGESKSSKSSEPESFQHREGLDIEDDYIYGDGDSDAYYCCDGDGDNDDDWRWSYR